MSSKTMNASKGLWLLFIAEIIMIITAVATAIPLAIIATIAGIAAIVALVLMLVGLGTTAKDAKGFKIAFILTLVQIAMSIVAVCIPDLTIIGIFSAVSDIISILVAFFVITTAASLCDARGKKETAKLGSKVWKLYALAIILSVVLSLLLRFGVIAGEGTILTIISIAVAVLAIIGYVLYVIFLYKASRDLK